MISLLLQHFSTKHTETPARAFVGQATVLDIEEDDRYSDYLQRLNTEQLRIEVATIRKHLSLLEKQKHE